MSLPVPNAETFDQYTIIDNKPFSEHLTTFLNTKAENGYVLNLNAEWGAGKTTFLHCWYNQLSENHPVIYFDAWKSDFSKDAMLALVDCFQDQLTNPISSNKNLIKGFLGKSSHFIRKSAPAMAVGYLKHKTGVSDDESLIEDVNDTLGLEIAEQECGDALKDVLKSLCEQRKKVQGIAEFKSALESMAHAVIKSLENTESPKNYPIYILIDELDRCRPSYAIEVIENIKHFFDTKNFVFVIATDTGQLQHSIKAIYGNDFDAYSYLSRFFHKTVSLPPPSTKQYLKSRLEPIIDGDFSFDEPLILQILVNIFDWHNMTSLREIDKVIQDLELAKSSRKQIKILPLTVLSVLKRLHPIHYSAFTKQQEYPYRYDRKNSKGTYHLPNNNSIPNIRFSSTITENMEQVLFGILESIYIDYDSNVTITWAAILNNDTINQNTHNAIHATSFHFLLNPKGKDTSFSDYMQILELAGHFE